MSSLFRIGTKMGSVILGEHSNQRLVRALKILGALAIASVGALVVAASLGTSDIALSQVAGAIFGHGDSTIVEVVRDIRIPRALTAFATGGLLALAGTLMQVLLRNPLADPYVLGLSGAAAVGALGAMLLGLAGVFVDAGAFGGAVISVALVFGLAHRDMAVRHSRIGDATPRLLLMGVILGAAWGALITVILILAPESRLRGMLFWLMGDLSGSESFLPALVSLPLLVTATFPLSRDLNVMSRGDSVAHATGVNVIIVRRSVLLLASFATAIAVTTAGAIGFVGLIVPHALRLVVGNDQRVLIPGAALAGGTFLLAADTLARTAFAPQQVPVGVVTSLIGVPAFIYLLLRRAKQ